MPGPAQSCLLALLAAAPAAAAEKGAWWQTTVEMQMGGFAMPATTVKVCAPEGEWKEPPAARQDDGCRTSQVRRSGSRMTWKVVCDQPEPMEGEGEVVMGADSYTGSQVMRSASGEMRMKMSGKKVGGACDPEAQRREAEQRVKQVEAQAAQAQALQGRYAASVCSTAVQSMNARMLGPDGCTDPAATREFCARLQTPAGFLKVEELKLAEQANPQAVGGPAAAAALCKQDLSKVRAALCKQSLAEEGTEFLAAECPEEARALARKECTGIQPTGTARGSRFLSFCSQMAGRELDAASGEKQAPPKKEPAPGAADAAKKEALEQGKKALKGIFGF